MGQWGKYQKTWRHKQILIIYFLHNREELRGISRGKDAKDIDWQQIAGPNETEDEDEEEEVVEKPKPVKVPVSEVLKRAGKPHLKKTGLNSKRVNKKGKIFLILKN